MRYAATADPKLENPEENHLYHREAFGCVTVCGASMYRERLHIPAEIDGGQLSAIQERWAEAQRGAVLHWVETFPDIPRFVRRIILQSYLTPDPEELLARYC